MTLGERLKLLRTQRKLTADELSKHIGVSPNSIFNWEANRRKPDIDTLKIVADYFKVPIDYFMTGSTEPVKDYEIPNKVNDFVKDVQVLFYNNAENLTDDKKKMLLRIIKATIDDE